MKALVVVERFWPEDFLVNDFVAEWQKCGDEVEVLTQIPSYPFDRIFDGYKNQAGDEQINVQLLRPGFKPTAFPVDSHSVTIHRVSTVLGYNSSVRRKVWNYIHFALATAWWALWHGRKYDRVFIYHTAALLMASSAVPLKLIWRKPITIWTQDLWPDAVYAYGFKPKWWKAAILNTFVRLIYGCCSRICVSCPSYLKRIKELTGRDAEFIPQWEPGEFQAPSGIRTFEHSTNKTVFMFAGNLGVPQNLENDIEGFIKADIPDAELWIVGGGVRLDGLKAKYGTSPGVKFCGRQPRADMPKWFAQADVLLISLTKEYQLTFPAKFQSYIKTGKPLLGIIEGDVKRFIADEHLGWTAAPDNLSEIAAVYQRAADEVRDGKGAEYGRNAVALSERMFDKGKCVSRLIGENLI